MFTQISLLVPLRKGVRAPLGTAFRFRLNEAARVRFAFAMRKGRRFKGVGALSFSGHPGKNRVKFQGRLSRHKTLQPGIYRMTATASAGGSRSKPRSLSFTIVR
jgi:hypothetical protein